MMLKKIALVVLLVLAIASSITFTVLSYPAHNAIDKTLERCVASVDGGTMSECLDIVIDNMEAYGITSGHAGLFPNPANDVALDYESLQGLRDRAWTIAQDPVNEQVALADVRTAVADIEDGAGQWVNMHFLLPFLITWTLWMCLGFLVVAQLFA